jgi:hypothetical protein
MGLSAKARTRGDIALQTPEMMLRRGRRERRWQMYCNRHTEHCIELRWPGQFPVVTAGKKTFPATPPIPCNPDYCE